MKKLISITLISFLATTAWAQQENNNVRSGNKQYKAEKYTEAEIDYRRAWEKNNKSFETNFNLGNALFRQEKYADALQYYQNAAVLSQDDKQQLAATYHNAGNALLVDNKIEESIAAYKNALKNNPKDNDTRYNLAYAQMLLKKQEENKDEEKPEDKEDEQEQQQQPQPQKPQPQQPQMSKENAQQILDALMQDEKETQEKLKKEMPKGKREAEKDW